MHVYTKHLSLLFYYIHYTGSYCCIARNCMGETKSVAELTVEDIQNQLNDEERLQLLTTNLPPKFIIGLRSCEARIEENFRFSVQGENKFTLFTLCRIISNFPNNPVQRTVSEFAHHSLTIR